MTADGPGAGSAAGGSDAGSAVWRFEGEIAGFGCAGGPRFVIGRWWDSPLGSFTDVMVEDLGGRRTLLAPDARVADFVATTYTFDEVVTGPVQGRAEPGHRWVSAPGLAVTFSLGRRPPLGWLLAAQPRRLARSTRWVGLLDPIASVVLDGVRTRGAARDGRREFYGAYDLRRIAAVEGRWRGRPLGGVVPVDPPVRFGFGSTPRQPTVTRLVTTVVAD